MTEHRWEEIKALFHQAASRPADARAAYLEQVCAGNEALRAEVESLLAADSDAESAIQVPAAVGRALGDLWSSADIRGADVSALRPGAHVGPYNIIAPLGGGGMGEVYKARDARLGRDVAIKVLPAGYAVDPDRVRRFEQEARAAGGLNHSGILTIHDIGSYDGAPYIVSELLEGDTLRTVLGGATLPVQTIVAYAAQIADALTAAHAKGIVHRDIKPSNIFVTDRGQAKILDFGVAKLTAHAEPVVPVSVADVVPSENTLTRPGVAVGTVAYMSPEQARGESIDARSDLFSLGAVVYEMATGQRAFPKALDWTSPPGTSAVNRELYRIVLKSVAVDRNARYQTASELSADLKRLQTRLRPDKRSRRLWLAGGLAIAAVLALTFVAQREQTTLQAVELTRVTSDSGLTVYPALSRDGEMLAYASDRAGGILNIWLQQVGTGEPVRVTNGPADDTEPSFSPDGARIAFRSERDAGGVYTVPTSGGVTRRIADGGRRPRFSPDGQWIVYWIGERHLFARNAVYIVRSTGGEPRRLASTFFSADDPLWSADGRHILFLGAETDKKPVADRYDWWVVPIDGGPPVPTGALALLRNKGVFPVWREPADWVGDTVLFAASTAQYAGILSTGAVNQSSIWSVRLLRDLWRVQGDPQQLTVASGVEAQPSMALADTSTGRVALANTPGNMEIWTLPVRGNEGEVTGEMKRLTTTVVENTYPSLSVDGNRLVFASDRHRNTDIFALDLRTGTEIALTTTDFNEFSPFLSADNSNVLYYDYRPDQKPSFTFWVASAAGGTPRKVCADCDGPLYGWSANAKRVVYGDLPTGKGRVRVRYVDSGRDDVLVEHPKYAIRFPRVSPDERWILFQTVISQTQRQIFAAPLGGWRAAPESSWIPITNGRTPDRNAVWSPSGSLVYFLSERDGFRCFWAQTLDPTTKRPRGEPFAVQHFHEARRRFSPDDFVGLTLTVGPDKIAFPMRERTGNIWLATLETR